MVKFQEGTKKGSGQDDNEAKVLNSIEPAKTRDGSWTCFNQEVGEHYHNLAGAFTESRMLYIEPLDMEKQLESSLHLRILDPFLGLGYNTLLCLEKFASLKKERFPEARLTMICFESNPAILPYIPLLIERSNINDLKSFLPLFEHNTYYQTQLVDLEHLSLSPDFTAKKGEVPSYEAYKADSCKAGTPLYKASEGDSGISLHVYINDTRMLVRSLPDKAFDAIFHDPFSPLKQPELWTAELFRHYFRILKPENGIVLTYSAAASVRKAFIEAGFHIYTVSGPQFQPNCSKGKRGQSTSKVGTFAVKSEHPNLPLLSGLELELIESRSGIPYEDNSSLSMSREEIRYMRDCKYQSSELPSSSSIHNRYRKYSKSLLS